MWRDKNGLVVFHTEKGFTINSEMNIAIFFRKTNCDPGNDDVVIQSIQADSYKYENNQMWCD